MRSQHAQLLGKECGDGCGREGPSVRLFMLAPGDVIPWHFHSAVADVFFVLDGELTVETRAPDDWRALGVGQRHRVNPGHAHQTSNRGANDCRFLIAKRLASTTLKVLTAVQVGATGGT